MTEQAMKKDLEEEVTKRTVSMDEASKADVPSTEEASKVEMVTQCPSQRKRMVLMEEASKGRWCQWRRHQRWRC